MVFIFKTALELRHYLSTVLEPQSRSVHYSKKLMLLLITPVMETGTVIFSFNMLSRLSALHGYFQLNESCDDCY